MDLWVLDYTLWAYEYVCLTLNYVMRAMADGYADLAFSIDLQALFYGLVSLELYFVSLQICRPHFELCIADIVLCSCGPC